MIIDTHAHLMFPEFEKDLEEVLTRARAAGVAAIINAGCGVEASEKSVEMADGKFLYATVGLHPYDAGELTDELIEKWRSLISGDSKQFRKIVAVGETGLDYFKAKVPADVQKKSFEEHVKLAEDVDLPVIVHNRNADDECLEILKKYPGVEAVFHCFGSSLEFAKKVWDAGYYTSFTGIVTYPAAEELRKVLKEVPMDRFFVETDAPYLAPQLYRGSRNEPAYVGEVLKCAAEVKGLDFKVVESAAFSNSVKFFDIYSTTLPLL